MPTVSDTGPVLITGCSSGIGEATAQRLLAAGYLVYATARRPEMLRHLEGAGARLMPLDVTDEQSRSSAVAAIVREHGRVGALVNNAGYGTYGAVEDVPMQRVRDQFETNFFGMAALTQLVLPAMREHGSGRVVNVSSMGGRFTLPFGGYYHASKYAVESFSDALRAEVATFGVQVAVIEPGLIRTRFAETAAGSLTAATPEGSAYREAAAAVDAAMARSYRNRAMTASREAVAAAVERAIRARKPRARTVISPMARVMITARTLAPGRAWDSIARRSLGL